MKTSSLSSCLLAVAIFLGSNAFITNTYAAAKNPFKKTPAVNIDGINYRLNAKDAKATVVAGKNLYAGEIVIPEKVVHDSVTYYVEQIDAGAFKECSTLTAISIPTTVTKIGSDAFRGCVSLESITIPQSVTELKSSTFESCSNLKEVILNESVKQLGSSMFEDCTSLETIILPAAVTSLPSDIFKGCSSLKNIQLPPALEKIGSSAFENCSSLEAVKIPNGVKSFGSRKVFHALPQWTKSLKACLRDVPVCAVSTSPTILMRYLQMHSKDVLV